MNKLVSMVTAKSNASGLRLCPLPDLPNIKKLYPHLENKTQSFIVSHHIAAMAVRNERSNYPIVVYVDLHNENILAIFYEGSNLSRRFGIRNEGLNDIVIAGTVRVESLLERVSNGLMPNTSAKLAETLIGAIIAFGANPDATLPVDGVRHLWLAEEKQTNGKSSIEFLHPRFGDPVREILTDLFTRYDVDAEIPSDLFHSQDKVWVYPAKSKSHPNSYIELEIRQAQRAIDKGFEFRVVDPGYKRRIIDADGIVFN